MQIQIRLLPGAVSELFAQASSSGKITKADQYGLMAALLEDSLTQRVARVPTLSVAGWGGTAVRRRYGVEQSLLWYFLRLDISLDSFDRSAASGRHIIRARPKSGLSVNFRQVVSKLFLNNSTRTRFHAPN